MHIWEMKRGKPGEAKYLPNPHSHPHPQLTSTDYGAGAFNDSAAPHIITLGEERSVVMKAAAI